jgi:hypothetical protein
MGIIQKSKDDNFIPLWLAQFSKYNKRGIHFVLVCPCPQSRYNECVL